MQPALLDTSIYITALRIGDEAVLALRRLKSQLTLWLSAVVLAELYAGTSDLDRWTIERLERQFERLGRILVPTVNDWSQAGKALSRLTREHDYDLIGRQRMINDALIAMSAARVGMTVITANERDFARLAQIRSFRYEIVLPK